MTEFTKTGRLAAGVVALMAWVGLALYVMAETASQKGDWLAAVWTNLGFLTDLTNLFLAVVMTGVALGSRPLSRPFIVGWAVAAIATVGVGFWLIGGRLVFGESAVEDILLHGATPIAAVMFWLAFAPKGGLRWTSALFWLAWPLGYFTYALTRGGLTGEYAYGFLDPAKSSLNSIAATVGMVTAVCAIWGLILVVLDRLIGRGIGKKV